MKRVLLLLLGLVPPAGFAGAVMSMYQSPPSGHIYTVAQVEADLLSHRQAWAGHEVLVRSRLEAATDQPVGPGRSHPVRYYALASAGAGPIHIPSVLLDMGWPYPQTSLLRSLPVIGPLVPDSDPQLSRPALYRIRILPRPDRCRGPLVAPYSCPDALFVTRWS